MNTQVIRNFKIEGNVVEVKPLGEGFINDTFIVKTDRPGRDYILQRKNHKVFPDVPAMMENIVAITRHIKGKVTDPLRETLTVIPTMDGNYCCKDDDGNYWAVCLLIPGTVTYNVADTLELVRQGGIGIGRFQTQLADFDKPLHETIKGFHNLRYRFEQWDESLKRDAAGRKGGLADEIYFIEARRPEFMDFWKLVEDGTIPRRVAHNDTKLSNILFDERTGKVLCAIDLDTVMSSTSLCDVGDAVRTYTSSTVEDDPDYGSVHFCPDKYRAYMEGYLSERKDTLSDSEKEWLPFAGLYLTYEQTLRFLMDYIDGDTYYKIKYPEHNLVRTRSQMALLRSMEDKYDDMVGIVKELLK